MAVDISKLDFTEHIGYFVHPITGDQFKLNVAFSGFYTKIQLRKDGELGPELTGMAFYFKIHPYDLEQVMTGEMCYGIMDRTARRNLLFNLGLPNDPQLEVKI